MPTNRRRYTRQRLGPDQRLDELDEFLLFGCLVNHRPDPDEVERAREYWDAHGEALTEEHARRYPGTRDAAWWRWSAPEPRPDDEDQADYLDRLGLLSADERKALGLAAATHPAARPRGPHNPRR